MLEDFSESALDVVAAAHAECLRNACEVVEPEHLLVAVTQCQSRLAAGTLASMNIKAADVQEQVDRGLVESGRRDLRPALPEPETIDISSSLERVFQRCSDWCRFLGAEEVMPEHLLLGLIDAGNEASFRILEDLGVNTTFLRRKILRLIAEADCLSKNTSGLKNTIISGLDDLVESKIEVLESLKNMASAVGWSLAKLPDRPELVGIIVAAYLPEFLQVQVAYQRYLLEETISVLVRRAGAVDREVVASIVSSTAQNLRAEVRATIEHVFTQELRMMSRMPDEVDFDLICSVMEDLWWAHSEEVALDEVFDEALDDYRRKHVLNLQKRRIEISERLTRICRRLNDTIHQCFRAEQSTA